MLKEYIKPTAQPSADLTYLCGNVAGESDPLAPGDLSKDGDDSISFDDDDDF